MKPTRPSAPSSPGEQASPPAFWRPEASLGTLVGGRYRLDALIGRGGAGATFRAHDLQLARDVALKMMLPRDGQASDGLRFIQEARIASRLRHPHIVEIFDVGAEGELPFMVMELLEGQTLQQALRSVGPLSPEQTFEIAFPLLGAVAFAHDQQVLHRDLKPDNIFLTVGPKGRVVPQLLDFGVAKICDGATLTRSGTVVGTPAYMAPEQALDEALSPASDVWSLGVMLHVMLTDKLPFEADSLASLLLKVVNTPARPLLEVAPTLPKLLAHVVDQALRREPAARPRDARRLARSLLHAALTEGLWVPHDPEPIGLPEYESWRKEFAAAGSTLETPRSVPTAVRATPLDTQTADVALGSERTGRQSTPRARVALWVALLVLLLAAGALGVRALLPNHPQTSPAPAASRAPSSGTPASPPPAPAPRSPGAEPRTPSEGSSGVQGVAPATSTGEAVEGAQPTSTSDEAAAKDPPPKRRTKPSPANRANERAPASTDELEFQEQWR